LTVHDEIIYDDMIPRSASIADDALATPIILGSEAD
jgi:hypothetical protein